MRKFLYLCSMIFISSLAVYSQDSSMRDVSYSDNMQSEYDNQAKLEQIYRELEIPGFSYQHDVDPDQYYDMQNSTWSPYPLLRLNSALFFKNITIEPGYYLLTPRKNENNWYLLFKEAGKVKYIIPVYDRDYTPESFYEDNIPEYKQNASQKTRSFVTSFAGKFKSSKRPTEKQSYLELNDLQNNFLQLILYWGDYKYYTIFRTVAL